MKISRINFPKITDNTNKDFVSYPKINNLNCDLFQKSEVSFSSLKKDRADIKDNPFLYMKREISTQAFLQACTASKSQLINISKRRSLEQFVDTLMKSIDEAPDFINNLLASSNINSIFQLIHFLEIYDKSNEIKSELKYQGIEAIQIYAELNDKRNLSKYPDLLLFLYKEEAAKENPDFNKLNETIDFISKIGIESSKDIDVKLSHLKNNFNDFNSTVDKIDAISYLQSTYDSKINLLDGILKSNSKTEKNSAEDVYKSNIDVIDYLYAENNEENLGDLNQYIEFVCKSNKLKPQIRTIFSQNNETEDKIALYKFLQENNISIEDANALNSKSIISDINILDCYTNYDCMSFLISDLRGVSEKEGQDIYKKFKDVVIAGVDEDNYEEYLKDLFKVIDTFSIKDEAAFLNYYNKIYGVKKKSITSSEFKSLLNLLKYSETKDIFDKAKKQNIPVLQMLTIQKEQTEDAIDCIEKFLSQDKTNYFAGQSAAEIFAEYKNDILQSTKSIFNVLQSIVDSKIKNSQQYKEKVLEIDKFEKFFPDRDSLLDFIKNNQIEFNGTEAQNKYRQACFDVLELVQNSDKEKSEERIKNLSESKFFLKSKKDLSKFVSKAGNNPKVFTVIADKKVPDTSSLMKYASKNYNIDNLIDFIASLPQDVDYNTAFAKIDKVQNQINRLNLSCKINNDNISAVDYNLINTDSKLSAAQLNTLFTAIYNKKDGDNIITTLPGAIKERQEYYSKFRIAEEIVNKLDKTDESYHNLEQMLNSGSGNSRNTPSVDNKSGCLQIREVEKKLPDNFVSFLNSTDWLQYSDDNSKIPDLSLHAKLRAIDRFALPFCENIDSLNSEPIKKRLQELFKAVYASPPTGIKTSGKTQRIIINSQYDSSEIETVFSKEGRMITIVQKT